MYAPKPHIYSKKKQRRLGESYVTNQKKKEKETNPSLRPFEGLLLGRRMRVRMAGGSTMERKNQVAHRCEIDDGLSA